MAGSTGRKSSVGASAVQLTVSSTPLTYGVSIKAAAANTGTVYVGFSNAVTANAADATDGYELSAGGEVFIPSRLLNSSPNVTDVWVIASAANQAVFWIGV